MSLFDELGIDDPFAARDTGGGWQPAITNPVGPAVIGRRAPAQPQQSSVLGAFTAPGSGLSALGGAIPNALRSPLGLGDSSATRVDPNYQRNLTTLTNKYADPDVSAALANIPDEVRNALMEYDSARVSRGSAPMTRDETLRAVQTAVTGEAATPQPDRNPLSFFSNIKSDVSDILKSIPRIPLAMLNEVRELPNIGTRIAEAQDAGENPISAMLSAPGIRMIPGAYVAGQLARGGQGVSELASHPIQTLLDVLPGVNTAAKGTAAGRLATEAAEAAGRRPRPISALMTGKVVRDAAGNQVLARNPFGRAVDVFRNESGVGQALDAFGGRRSRDVSRMRGTLEQRYHSLFKGAGTPESTVEAFAPRVTKLFDDYADEYPFLSKDAVGPAADEARATLYRDVQRTPENFNPAFVNELRDLQTDFAKYQESQGNLGQFDGEWYDSATANRLRDRESRITVARQVQQARNEYLNPSGQLTRDQLLGAYADAAANTSTTARTQAVNAVNQVADAYGVDIAPIKQLQSAAGRPNGGGWGAFTEQLQTLIPDQLTPRASATDVIAQIRRVRPQSRIAGRLEQAVRDGKRGDVSTILKGLERRKTPMFDDPRFADDVASLSRRMQFDDKVGRRFTDARIAQRERAFERTRDATAPARFHGLLSDQVTERATAKLRESGERELGRTLTDTEAGSLVSSVMERRWQSIPGLDDAVVQSTVRQIENEVTATWRALREAGHDPVFVHRVSPGRANTALAGNINPVPVKPSSTKERALDLSPEVNDLQVSLTHQAGEMLQKDYNERFVEQIIDYAGIPESQLREQLADQVRWRQSVDPSLDFEGHLSATVRRGYERFNPDEAGHSWGGARLNKFRPDAGGETYFIPKALASNLKQYAKPPSLVSSVIDPLTKAFRYNVIGLSPSVALNNFFSNSVAVMAESGPGAFKYWGRAKEWIKDPSKIPNEQLKAMMLTEIPHMEYLNRDAWLKSRNGQRFMQSFNAGKAFQDSAFAEAARTGKRGLDVLAAKNLRMQTMGDNIYRAMQYMDEFEKQTRRGKSASQASDAAMEMVRRTLVDYASFTPIERSAMRTIIPFYSYMGHAARFIARYPLDHPLRASIGADLAKNERERLGALPGSWLSMVPIPDFLPGGGKDEAGNQNMLALRPFDPFGDISDLLSVSGWLAATNPVVQTILSQAGVERGEAELYPTMRYNPETGRMQATRPGILSSLFHNTVPRAGVVTSALGANPEFNELRRRDPDAAARNILSQLGLPRAWRQFNVHQEQFKAENARADSANDVLNEAIKSGDWSEAMRYPSLRDYYSQMQSLPPDVIESMTPGTPEDVMAQILGAGVPGR